MVTPAKRQRAKREKSLVVIGRFFSFGKSGRPGGPARDNCGEVFWKAPV
jgi:hypothetical protein